MQEAKEEVRSRLNIEDVVGEYVQLKRAGRSFKGLSPFTSEKTPSFVVSPEKHIWHDFSSGKGGDVFSFVMEVEGIDFRAALELLARKAGVELAQYDSKKAGDISRKKKRLLEANALAKQFFQQSLLQNTHALEYVFKKRALTKEIVSEFGIGYAPTDKTALVRILEKRGFSRQEIDQAGLANRFGGDIFRGRMTVPLMDASGQVIGFTGRIIGDDVNAPKYLNTPQTMIYDKSRHVFGLSQAKETIRTLDEAVIVEGNLDVVSSHQAGIKQVVATAGTAITEGHLKALSRLTSTIKLAFDGDKAGLAATERAIPLAQSVGVELSIITLPGGVKDPDELIQKDVGLWDQAITGAKPVIDWVLERYAQQYDLQTAEGKRRFTTEALRVLTTVGDIVEVEHYQKQIATMTTTSFEAVKRKMDQSASPETTAQLKAVQPTRTPDDGKQYSHEDILLAALIMAPHARQLIAETDIDLFHGDERQVLARFLRTHQGIWGQTPPELSELDTYVKIVELKAETRYEDWTEADLQLEVARLLRQMHIEHKKQTTEALLAKLRDAEEAGDEASAETLRRELHELIKETRRG